MKNYKNIRTKPYIYGFSVVGFFTFSIGGILALLSLLGGFTVIKVGAILFFLGVLFLLSKYVISNRETLNKITNQKLPRKYSEYE